MLAAVFEIGWRWDRDFALRRSAVSQPRALDDMSRQQAALAAKLSALYE
jgi:hypothetical protein